MIKYSDFAISRDEHRNLYFSILMYSQRLLYKFNIIEKEINFKIHHNDKSFNSQQIQSDLIDIFDCVIKHLLIGVNEGDLFSLDIYCSSESRIHYIPINVKEYD